MTAGALLGGGSGDVGAQVSVAGDFNGDGRADLILGAAGEDLGARIDAGALTVVYGDRRGIDKRSSQSISQGRGIAGRVRAGNQFGRTFATGDIDGDGYSDVVAGAPNDRVGGADDAGSATSLYGSRGGLTGAGSELLTQPSNAAAGPETGDRFGSAVALGDFDGDGYDDLAVGAPDEDVADVVNAGVVNVFSGSRSGLRVGSADTFTQGDRLPDSAELGDRFGAALAVGDFDGDGFDDLAVGAPGESVDGAPEAGAAIILYGSPAGLDRSRAQMWSQSGSVDGAPADRDHFGAVLATGDFDGDGRDDLAVGVPNDDVGRFDQAGAVNVIRGSRSGLVSARNRLFSQRGRIPGRPGGGDHFGAALAAGDFDGNGRDDLAVGVPGENRKALSDSGVVAIIDGSARGLRPKGSSQLSQAGRIKNSPQPHDRFGSSLLAVNLDGDRRDDLVIGVPGEDIGRAEDAGLSNVVFGSAKGLQAAGNTVVSQAGPVRGRPQSGDSLGRKDFDTWLDRVNLYRSQAGLDPVRERDDLSADAQSHSRYLVINGRVAHDQDLSLPGASQAGHDSGMRSNVYGTSASNVADVTAVDGWVTGPFHAVGFLTPSLREVGYGVWRDADADLIRMAATLDIYGGERHWDRSIDKAYAWPGDGSVVPVNRHITEWPSPRSHCPGHDGLPVLAFFEKAPSVSATSFTHDGNDVEFCVFDGSNYRSSDSAAQQTGRAILSGTNTVVVMAKEQLTPGERYCFSVRSRGESVRSCFRVDPNA